MAVASKTPSTTSQAHLLRSSKFGDGRTRDWSLYVFFRVLSQREISRTFGLLDRALNAKEKGKQQVCIDMLRSELVSPRRMYHSETDEQWAKLGAPRILKDKPAPEFFNWLKLAASADLSGLKSTLNAALTPYLKDQAILSSGARLGEKQTSAIGNVSGLISRILKNPKSLSEFLQTTAGHFNGEFGDKEDVDKGIEKLLSMFGADHAKAGLTALSGGLPLVILYELLRQTAVAALNDRVGKDVGPAHDEFNAEDRLSSIKQNGKQLYDSVSSNYAFTHAGLEALHLDETILKSFPEPFKEGMAARAELLGDTGESAPENWYGELGQKSIHGYFTGGFQVGSKDNSSKETQWRKLRADVEDFNSRTRGNGESLRLFINAIFRLLGMEIVHLEVAQDPYRVTEDDVVVPEPHRMEHFGFRDGISQPFVDMNLGAPAAGGGTPGRNRSWKPISPGEILLDQKDEDGRIAMQPYNADLREGGTFLVFRKLEQDVEGFRGFLAGQRPGDSAAQKKLAAQFMGRWPNGAAMVHSPDKEPYVGPENEGELNNFLFVKDDPYGQKCPLGSHIRRANPRDIDGNNDVRRHRILRRGMPYGGPLLPVGSKGDGSKRGLFFIAANARIDLQFEVVQSIWMNRGSFAGQSGLGKCPIIGPNDGGCEDQFLEAGAGVPITRVPRFVVTRGGDYFFAPGVKTLQRIAEGESFKLPKDQLPYKGVSMGDAKTPSLLDKDKLERYAFAMLEKEGISAIRVNMPAAPRTLVHEERKDPDLMFDTPGMDKPVVFIAKHKDVSDVISSKIENGKAVFSVAPYQESGNRLLRGGHMLIGTEEGGPTADDRKRLMTILNGAWKMLHGAGNLEGRLEEITKRELNASLKRSAATGKIDLVDDMATNTVYAIVKELFGIPGPAWLTEMAISLPFARQHIGQIYPDWLSILEGKDEPENKGCRTMQVWSAVLFLDIVGNYFQMKEIKAVANQAAAEMLAHFDILLAKAAQDVPSPFAPQQKDDPMTLLDCFILQSKPLCDAKGWTQEEYMTDVRGLLLELVCSAMMIIPANFASIMEATFQLRLDLPTLVPMLERDPQFGDAKKTKDEMPGVTRFVYEAARVNPTVRMLIRKCMAKTELPSGFELKEGEWIACLMGAANLDEKAFTNSHEFSLGPYDGGPERLYENYLLFGADGGGRKCWGREKIALYVLENCVRAASKLSGLSSIAGDKGEVEKKLGISVGLKARYGELLGLL